MQPLRCEPCGAESADGVGQRDGAVASFGAAGAAMFLWLRGSPPPPRCHSAACSSLLVEMIRFSPQSREIFCRNESWGAVTDTFRQEVVGSHTSDQFTGVFALLQVHDDAASDLNLMSCMAAAESPSLAL